MKYCFGPVPSRRLGLSLGVDILPPKTCNLNCVYCELGSTKKYTCERNEYIPAALIRAELEDVLCSGKTTFDVLTFTASGEPTLHTGIGELLAFAKGLTDKPIAVITNSTLLSDSQVREELCHADILLPSLDSVVLDSFRRINRPAKCVDLKTILDGLIKLRKEFKGKIWLEVLFVREVNHGTDEIRGLKKILKSIQPDKIQLNTVVRPPVETWANPLSKRQMEKLKKQLGEKAEVIVDYRHSMEKGIQPIIEAEILDTLLRRPLSIEDLQDVLGLGSRSVQDVLNRMYSSGLIKLEAFDNKLFYIPGDKAGV
ncbi:MAG: radical SAM protein [Thermodesulfobacteriota bacterium]|nr:radical SAM protein [Thermodesulfobacteriota bacterium]